MKNGHGRVGYRRRIQMKQMQDKWTYCYRIRPSFRDLGVFGTAFTVAMSVLFVFAWVNQPANSPVRMPFVVSGLLLFTALSPVGGEFASQVFGGDWSIADVFRL